MWQQKIAHAKEKGGKKEFWMPSKKQNKKHMYTNK